ncbi:hypothetical protein HDV06_000809 [Boothiomyces sp. JEL0866]|nr:hypothetical protein HDV06_000809 [Boothiomyces sp. JEL0866]
MLEVVFYDDNDQTFKHNSIKKKVGEVEKLEMLKVFCTEEVKLMPFSTKELSIKMDVKVSQNNERLIVMNRSDDNDDFIVNFAASHPDNIGLDGSKKEMKFTLWNVSSKERVVEAGTPLSMLITEKISV